MDRFDVVLGRHLAVHVHDIGVGEHPDDLADRVCLADVREELVAQALTLGRALHDPGDVDEAHRRGHLAGRAEDRGQDCEASVGDADDSDVGLDRRERVVRRYDVVLGQRVEQGGLAHVGQPDDADGEGGHGPVSL